MRKQIACILLLCCLCLFPGCAQEAPLGPEAADGQTQQGVLQMLVVQSESGETMTLYAMDDGTYLDRHRRSYMTDGTFFFTEGSETLWQVLPEGEEEAPLFSVSWLLEPIREQGQQRALLDESGEDPLGMTLLLQPNSYVRDVTWLAVEAEADPGGVIIHTSTSLAEVGSVAAGEKLMLRRIWEPGGIQRGISCVDENGREHTYVIVWQETAQLPQLIPAIFA